MAAEPKYRALRAFPANAATARAEALWPTHCGSVSSSRRVTVTPEPRTENSYAIRFEIFKLGTVEKLAARIRTEHVVTSRSKRARIPIPPALAAWLAAG